MSFCSHCGKEVSVDDSFCRDCGQRLKKEFTREEKQWSRTNMELFFCPRGDSVAGHDKVRTVWFNGRAGLFECLDNRCKGKFSKAEIAICNRRLPGINPRVHCPICGSSNIVYAGYGGEHPRFKCREFGHIFT